MSKSNKKKIKKKNTDITCRENQIINFKDLHMQLCEPLPRAITNISMASLCSASFPQGRKHGTTIQDGVTGNTQKQQAVCVELGECGVGGSQLTG